VGPQAARGRVRRELDSTDVSGRSGALYPGLRRTIEEVTQCVLVVGDSRLRIAKAEGRPPGIVGSVFHYRDVDELPALTPAPVASRIGAGVSPSAISQAERGKRGLSLETLLELTGNLNMSIDELLRGDVVAGYRIGRRNHPRTRRVDSVQLPLPLLDDPTAGLRAYSCTSPRGRPGLPISHTKGRSSSPSPTASCRSSSRTAALSCAAGRSY
jgi:transcriptional regulator with XRE-family HTH domain